MKLREVRASRSFFHAQGRGSRLEKAEPEIKTPGRIRKETPMPYRKVGYLKQCWYIIKGAVRMKLKERRKHRAKKTETSMCCSWMPKPY